MNENEWPVMSHASQEELLKCMDLGAIGFFVEGIRDDLFVDKVKAQVSFTAAAMRVSSAIQTQLLRKPLRDPDAVLPDKKARVKCSLGYGRRGRIPTASSLALRLQVSAAARKRKSTLLLSAPHTVTGKGLNVGFKTALEQLHSLTFQDKYSDPSVYQRDVQYKEYHDVMRPLTKASFEDPLMGSCITINPSSVCKNGEDSYVAHGYEHFVMENYKEALGFFKKAIGREKQVALALFLRACVLHVLGRHRHAEDDLTKCIERKVKFHQAFYNRSIVRLALGKDEAALADLEVAVQLNPVNELYLKNRALLYRRLRTFDVAQVAYHKVLGRPMDTAVVATTDNASSATNLLGEYARHDMPRGIHAKIFSSAEKMILAAETVPHQRTSEMVQAIADRLERVGYLKLFSRPILEECARKLEFLFLVNGESTTHLVENPDAMYIVLSGSLAGRHVVDSAFCTVTVRKFRKNDVFGSFGIPMPRIDFFVCEEDAEILVLSKTDYSSTIKPHWVEHNQAAFTFIKSLPIFKSLSDHDVAHVVNHSRVMTFKAGQEVLAQGVPVDHLYLLKKGLCSVYQSVNIVFDENLVDEAPFVQPFHHRSNILHGTVPTPKTCPTHRKTVRKQALGSTKSSPRPVWTLDSRQSKKRHTQQTLLATCPAPDVFGDAALGSKYRNISKA